MGNDAQRMEDHSLCAACGGLCCRRAPGRFSPDELGSDGIFGVNDVEVLLDTGLASITTSFVAVYNRRVAPLFAVAARGLGRGELELCASNICCLQLRGDGCLLALEQRPFECAMMVPNKEVSECRLPDDLSMEELWLPHQQVLRQVIERRSGIGWDAELKRQVLQAPAYDQYAQGARELLGTLGLATDHDEIVAVTESAWAQS